MEGVVDRTKHERFKIWNGVGICNRKSYFFPRSPILPTDSVPYIAEMWKFPYFGKEFVVEFVS